jgi:hypothetical protein
VRHLSAARNAETGRATLKLQSRLEQRETRPLTGFRLWDAQKAKSLPQGRL